MNFRRILFFSMMVAISPYVVGIFQGLTLSFFFEAYGYNRSPADAAINVRHVRWGILATLVFILYFSFVVKLVYKPFIHVFLLFVFAVFINALIEEVFGDFNISQFFSLYLFAHLAIGLLSIFIYHFNRRP